MSVNVPGRKPRPSPSRSPTYVPPSRAPHRPRPGRRPVRPIRPPGISPRSPLPIPRRLPIGPVGTAMFLAPIIIAIVTSYRDDKPERGVETNNGFMVPGRRVPDWDNDGLFTYDYRVANFAATTEIPFNKPYEIEHYGDPVPYNGDLRKWLPTRVYPPFWVPGTAPAPPPLPQWEPPQVEPGTWPPPSRGPIPFGPGAPAPAPRRTPMPRYRRSPGWAPPSPSTSIEIDITDTGVRVRRGDNTRPPRGTRELKRRSGVARALASALANGLDGISEGAEFLDILLEHAGVDRSQGFPDQLNELLNEGLDRVDPLPFARDVALNEVEDQVVGRTLGLSEGFGLEGGDFRPANQAWSLW